MCNFIVSVGMDYQKNVFAFLLGLFCAIAIFRVSMLSSIVVLSCFGVGFAVGITVEFSPNG